MAIPWSSKVITLGSVREMWPTLIKGRTFHRLERPSWLRPLTTKAEQPADSPHDHWGKKPGFPTQVQTGVDVTTSPHIKTYTYKRKNLLKLRANTVLALKFLMLWVPISPAILFSNKCSQYLGNLTWISHIIKFFLIFNKAKNHKKWLLQQ